MINIDDIDSMLSSTDLSVEEIALKTKAPLHIVKSRVNYTTLDCPEGVERRRIGGEYKYVRRVHGSHDWMEDVLRLEDERSGI